MTHSVLVTNRSHFDGDLYSYPRFTRAASESVITTDDASQVVYIFVDLVVCPSSFCSNLSDIYGVDRNFFLFPKRFWAGSDPDPDPELRSE